MKLLKQKIIFLLYAREGLTTAQRLQKQTKYLSYNFFYNLLLNYEQASIRKAVRELVQSGEIDQIIRGRKVFLRLTVIGEKKIRRFFPNFFYQQIKSEGWVIAVVKKTSQARMIRLGSPKARQVREELRKIGFITLSRGVYFQAAKLEFVKSLEELAAKVLFIFARKLEFTDEKQVAGKLWNLDQFYKEGQDFIIRAKKVLTKVVLQSSLNIQEKKMVSVLFDKFFIIIKNTIRLPKNLLPDDWPLPEAAKLFSRISRKVE